MFRILEDLQKNRCHYTLAAILERDPFIVPRELLKDAFDASYKTKDRCFESPLFMSGDSFADTLESRGLLPDTAKILDEMTSIIAQIVDYRHRSDFENQCFLAKTKNFQQHILALPSADIRDLPSTSDYIYESIRLTTKITLRAILSEIPFSIACSEKDLAQLYEAINRVPLTKWKKLSGVWSWVLLTINPKAKDLQVGVRLRYELRFAAVMHAVREWQGCVNAMEVFLEVQKWIRSEGKSDINDSRYTNSKRCMRT